MFDAIKGILISEKEFTGTNYKRLQEVFYAIENNLIDIDSGMHLTVDSLIEMNNIITGSNNITLRKVNAKPYRFVKMYMDKELIEDELYQIIDHIQWEKNYIYKVLFNTFKIHLFYDGNGRMCKVLFANDTITRQNI